MSYKILIATLFLSLFLRPTFTQAAVVVKEKLPSSETQKTQIDHSDYQIQTPKKAKSVLKWLKGKKKKSGKKSKEGKLVSRYALIGFLLSIGGLFFFPLFLPAFILCFLGLRQIRREPDTWKGKWMAITGLILTGLFVILAIFAVAGFIGII